MMFKAPPQGLPIEALLPATAYVVASDAPLAIRQMTTIVKPYFGALIQICDGNNDQEELQVAINALPVGGGGIFISGGILSIDNLAAKENISCLLRSHVSMFGKPGTIIKTNNNTDTSICSSSLGMNDDPWWYAYQPDFWWFLNGDAANWAVIAGAAVISNDAAIFQQGTGSLKVAVSAQPCEVKRSFTAVDISKDGVLAIWVRVRDASATPTSVKLWSGVNYIKWDFQTRATNEWVELFCPLDAYDSSSGGVDLTAVDGISLIMNHVSTFNFDEFRVMPSHITLEGFEGLASSSIIPESVIRFSQVAFSTVRGLRIRNAGDESLEIHGCRGIVIDGCTLRQRYAPTGQGGPVVDLGPAQGAGATNGDIPRNRFCKITNTHIYCAAQTGITLCGDSNLIDTVTISFVGGGLTTAGTGIQIRHTYTTKNMVNGVTVEGARRAVVIGEGAYGNIINGLAALVTDSGQVVTMVSDAGPDNKLLNLKGRGVGNGQGVDIQGTSAHRTIIKGCDFDNFAVGVNFAAISNDVRIEGNHFYNLPTGISILAGCARTVCRQNKFTSVTTPIVDAGDDSIFDLDVESIALDLSGGAIDIIALSAAVGPHWLCGYTILYSEASSADAGVEVRVGRLQADGTLTNNYYDAVTSEVSKAMGYSKRYKSADLSQAAIATGESVTVGTAGGKVGTGEVKVILHIAKL